MVHGPLAVRYYVGWFCAGPAKWGEFTTNALGRHQSPIAIRSAEAVYSQRLRDSPLKLLYADMDACNLVNTGRSVQLVAPAATCCTSTSPLRAGPPSKSPPTVRLSPIPHAPGITELSLFSRAPCGLLGCKNRAAPFPVRMSYKATKPRSCLSSV